MVKCVYKCLCQFSFFKFFFYIIATNFSAFIWVLCNNPTQSQAKGKLSFTRYVLINFTHGEHRLRVLSQYFVVLL